MNKTALLSGGVKHNILPTMTSSFTLETSNMPCRYRQCKLSNYTMKCVQRPVACVALIMALLLQAFVPCSSTMYKFDLKQQRIYVSVLVDGTSHMRDSGYLEIVRRDTSSVLNMTQMKNNLNGLSGDGYYIDIDVGTPPQKMQVLIDTGSANFAIAGYADPSIAHFFHKENSSSFEDIGTEIYVPYTEGDWKGTLGEDIVFVASAPNISTRANIAVIFESKLFFVDNSKWQGILGLAYTELARPDSSYLPFWDSMVSTHPDVPNIFSIQLCGSSFIHTKEKPLMQGSLILGGVDMSMSKSPIYYTPIYKQWFYEVVLTDIQVEGVSLNMDCKEYNFDKTIVDSGTTNIRLPNKVFDAVVSAIEKNIQTQGFQIIESPGQLFYSGAGIICFEDMSRPFAVFPVISFFLLQSEHSSFRLDITPQHYLRPVEMTDGDAVSPAQSCVKFGLSPSETGSVLGAVLMEAFYVIFDRSASRIGFGQTSCPLPDPRHPIVETTISGPIPSNRNFSECAYKKADSGQKAFLVVSYIMAAVSVVIILPLVLLFFMWFRRLMSTRRGYRSEDETSETRTVLSDS